MNITFRHETIKHNHCAFLFFFFFFCWIWLVDDPPSDPAHTAHPLSSCELGDLEMTGWLVRSVSHEPLARLWVCRAALSAGRVGTCHTSWLQHPATWHCDRDHVWTKSTSLLPTRWVYFKITCVRVLLKLPFKITESAADLHYVCDSRVTKVCYIVWMCVDGVVMPIFFLTMNANRFPLL